MASERGFKFSFHEITVCLVAGGHAHCGMSHADALPQPRRHGDVWRFRMFAEFAEHKISSGKRITRPHPAQTKNVLL